MKSRGCTALTSRKEQTGEGKVHSDGTCYCSACGLAWSLEHGHQQAVGADAGREVDRLKLSL